MDQIEQTIVKHDEHFKVIDKRLDKLECLAEGLNKMNINIERIAVNQENTVNELKELKNEFNTYKQEDYTVMKKRRNDIITKIIEVIVCALIAAIMALIIK